MRRFLQILLLGFVAVSLATVVVQEVRRRDAAGSKPSFDGKGSRLVMTYFHSYKRCSTCANMEAFALAALKEHYPKHLAQGRIRWRVLNWQKPDNAGYVMSYDLIGNAIILSQVRDGKELRFKNLIKIWDHAHDRKAYIAYVRAEVAPFAGAM